MFLKYNANHKKSTKLKKNSTAFKVSLPDSEVPEGIISEYMIE